MYERHYGLRERPFSLTSNPRFLLLIPQHAEGLNALRYGISHRLGLVVLIGEAGSGKTTLLRAATTSQGSGDIFVTMNNPILSKAEFFRHLAEGFGLSEEAALSKTRFLFELTQLLHENLLNGHQAGLIVDEAHALPIEILEEIRLLSNIETDEAKLLPVVLAGQPELAGRLNEPALRQLKQRIALRCSLGALQIRETAAYIAGRVRVAGGEAVNLFTPAAVELIHECSRGLPRIISVICENALLTGFAAGERTIGRETILEVCRDLDLAVPEQKSSARPVVMVHRSDILHLREAPAPAEGTPDFDPPRPRGSFTARVRSFRPFLFRS